MKITKIVTGKFICPCCQEESFLEIDPRGDFAGHTQCAGCNTMFHVFCPGLGATINVTVLSMEAAINVFKLQEQYKDAPIPYKLGKTKRREEL